MLQLLGTMSLDPLPGLRPYTPLVDFRPQPLGYSSRNENCLRRHCNVHVISSALYAFVHVIVCSFYTKGTVVFPDSG